MLNYDWRVQIASQAVPLLVEVIAHPQSRKVKYHLRWSGVYVVHFDHSLPRRGDVYNLQFSPFF